MPTTPVQQREDVILLVDDDFLLLKMIATMLRSQGYNVLATTMPQEALQLAEDYRGKIHLLISDVVMPDMNGRELADKIVSFSPHLQCLFMSGYTDDIISQNDILNNEVHFISKPFTKNSLIAKVGDLLQRNEVVCPPV